jgi:hypothetical protein
VTQTRSYRPLIPIRNHRMVPLFPDRPRMNLARMSCHRSIPKFLSRKDSEALTG